MTVVNATIMVKPEKRDEFVTLVKGILELSRGEQGCISYSMFQDVGNDDRFVFVEEWDNQNSLDTHWRTPHFDRLFAALPDLIAAPPDLKVYEVSETKGMEAIGAARA